MHETTPRTSIALPVACCVGVTAFVVSLLTGVMVDNPAGAVLARSLVVLLVAWSIGLGLGVVLERLFREQAETEAAQILQADASAGDLDGDVEIIDDLEAGSDGPVVEGEPASTAA